MAIIYTKKDKPDKPLRKHDILIKKGVPILKYGAKYCVKHNKSNGEICANIMHGSPDIVNKKTGELIFKGRSYTRPGPISICNPVLKEPQNICGTIPDIIGWNWMDSYVIECKTSRADFLNDKHKKQFLGRYFFYLTWGAIIKAEELTYQGLIEYNPDIDMLIPRKLAEPREDFEYANEMAILLSIIRGRNRNSRC